MLVETAELLKFESKFHRYVKFKQSIFSKKNTMNKTIVLPHFHKNHSIPICLIDAIKQMKALNGIVKVGIGTFGNKSIYSHQFE